MRHEFCFSLMSSLWPYETSPAIVDVLKLSCSFQRRQRASCNYLLKGGLTESVLDRLSFQPICCPHLAAEAENFSFQHPQITCTSLLSMRKCVNKSSNRSFMWEKNSRSRQPVRSTLLPLMILCGNGTRIGHTFCFAFVSPS